MSVIMSGRANGFSYGTGTPFPLFDYLGITFVQTIDDVRPHSEKEYSSFPQKPRSGSGSVAQFAHRGLDATFHGLAALNRPKGR